MTTTRRRLASSIAFGLATAVSACGGDGLVLPDEARPATITIVSGNEQSAPAGVMLGQALVVRVTDALNRPVEGQTVAFTIDAGGGQVTPANAQTGTDGQASASWKLGAAAGQQRVQARVDGDNIPATLLVKFSASAVSGTGALLELVSGDNQTAAVGSALPDSLVVRVTDELLNPVAGVEVEWSTSGGGSISPATVVTGADGTAAAERVLGNTAGTQTAQAAVADLTPVTFTHAAAAANPTALVLVSGDGQIGAAGAALAEPLVVRLEDDNGNGVGGKAITWVVATGGGSASPVTATTNPNGFAETQWTLGPSAGSNLLNAVFSGLPSVPFTASAQAGAATKLAFTQPPVTTSAGSTITPAIRVAIQDAAGNTVTSATAAVTLAIGTNPAGGILSGTLTVNAVNGVATFANLSIDKNGNGYTLTASAAGLAATTSPAFDILTGSANRLVFIVEPTDRTVGQTFSPAIQVQVQDAGGNPVLLASNPITLTSSVTGTLSGNAVATPFLGTATFSNLAVNTAGDGYTLTALSSGVGSRTSVPFDVAQAGTTIAITSKSPTNTSVVGQLVTFQYDIDIASPGAGPITGTVTVTDGTDSCTGAISGTGGGNCQVVFTSPGSKSVTATYNGDQNLLGSSSAARAHTVNKANTTVNITSHSPEPSAVNGAVTVQWTLSPTGQGEGTPTGDVTIRASATEFCTAPASFDGGTCDIVLTSSGGRTLTASYPGDANFNAAPNDNQAHNVAVPNSAPVADNDSYTFLEDGSLNPDAAAGVRNGDTDADGDPLTAVLVSAPAFDQSFSLSSDGSFDYVPVPDFNGSDTFTYQAFDGSASSNTATVTITVIAVNDAPSFVVGQDQSVSASAGPRTIPSWNTVRSPGPSNESGQTVSFQVSLSPADSAEFTSVPEVDASGTLTYNPNPLSLGANVTVTIRAVDDGATANGGVDLSDPQTFDINIIP